MVAGRHKKGKNINKNIIPIRTTPFSDHLDLQSTNHLIFVVVGIARIFLIKLKKHCTSHSIGKQFKAYEENKGNIEPRWYGSYGTHFGIWFCATTGMRSMR